MRNNKRRMILGPRKHPVRLRIANAAIGFFVEVKRPSQTIRDVGEMHQCRRDGAFTYLRCHIFTLAAPYGVDKRGEGISERLGRSWSGLLTWTHERFEVSVIPIHYEIALRPVVD